MNMGEEKICSDGYHLNSKDIVAQICSNNEILEKYKISKKTLDKNLKEAKKRCILDNACSRVYEMGISINQIQSIIKLLSSLAKNAEKLKKIEKFSKPLREDIRILELTKKSATGGVARPELRKAIDSEITMLKKILVKLENSSSKATEQYVKDTLELARKYVSMSTKK